MYPSALAVIMLYNELFQNSVICSNKDLFFSFMGLQVAEAFLLQLLVG